LLQGGRPRNVDALAIECGVHRRTIFRDLDTFRRSGLNLLYDENEQGYRLPQSYFLPPTNFSHDEALALIVLCHELGARKQVPFYEAARSAAAKLENSLPAQLREELRRVAGAVHIKLEPSNPLCDQQSTYVKLLDAIKRKRAVRIDYHPPGGETPFRTRLSPYRLLFSRRSWYAIGRSSLHRSTRTFNVARIERLELLDDTFRMPKHFSVDRHLRNAWHLIPEPGPDHDVVILFDQRVASNVAEVLWHKTQTTELLPDGRLKFTVRNEREITSLFLVA
jgi:proteasome accessory factor B